ncbi:MAG: hypothetical protein P4L26_15685 [Terracidiphilus sp.]|nr:hypothetical protein [Terracidiphilus sp.]
MLQAMQQPAAPATSPTSPTFAGLLAALASPSSSSDRQPAWSSDDLADDVATLSYERALRAHSRYRSPDLADRSLTQPAEPLPDPVLDVPPAGDSALQSSAVELEAATDATTAQDRDQHQIQDRLQDQSQDQSHDRNLKSASITIRLSRDECAQLRLRAAEAGLTVSAYLRSCTFEAESLRAMVKDTLAQLRAEPGNESRTASTPTGHRWPQWLGRLRPHPRLSQPINQA